MTRKKLDRNPNFYSTHEKLSWCLDIWKFSIKIHAVSSKYWMYQNDQVQERNPSILFLLMVQFPKLKSNQFHQIFESNFQYWKDLLSMNYYRFWKKTWVDGILITFNENGRQAAVFSIQKKTVEGHRSMYVTMKKFPILSRLTSAKQSLKKQAIATKISGF